MKKIRIMFLFAILGCATCAIGSMRPDIDDLPITSQDGKKFGTVRQIFQTIEEVKKLIALPEKRGALIELAKAVHRGGNSCDDPKVIQCLQKCNLVDSGGGIPDCVRSIISAECSFKEGTLYAFGCAVHEKVLADAQLPRESREHKPSTPDERYHKVIPGATSYQLYGPSECPTVEIKREWPHPQDKDEQEAIALEKNLLEREKTALEKFFKQTKGKYKIIFQDNNKKVMGMYSMDPFKNEIAMHVWALKKLDRNQLSGQEIRS